MNYELVNASPHDTPLLKEYKLRSILDYEKDLTESEITKIKNYISDNIPKQIKDYKLIKMKDEIIGCILVTDYEDGKMLDEIYINEEQRGKGIGTKLIKDIIELHNVTYLWVYINNKNAVKLYKKLGFVIEKETDTRYFMKYTKE